MKKPLLIGLAIFLAVVLLIGLVATQLMPEVSDPTGNMDDETNSAVQLEQEGFELADPQLLESEAVPATDTLTEGELMLNTETATELDSETASELDALLEEDAQQAEKERATSSGDDILPGGMR